MSDPQPIEIFRVGTFQPLVGDPITFSESDLKQIARDYDPEVSEAPVVVGHPATDAPAYAWVDALYIAAGILKAVIKQTEPAFAECLKEGRYKRVSASFFKPNAPNNPRPGRWYLRHVGVLGASAPAVSGLKNISFSSNSEKDCATFTAFAEKPATDDKYAEFAAREAKIKERENDFFLDKVINEGRMLPYYKSGAVAFLSAIDGAGSVSFADKDGETVSVNPVDWFRNFVATTPKFITFGRHPMPIQPDDSAQSASFATPKNHTVNPDNFELHKTILAVAKSQGVSYEDALKIVAKDLKP